MHFDEIDDRDVAEIWRDRFLLLPADELEPLGEGEVYVHDLLGMRVELVSGEAVGTVAGRTSCRRDSRSTCGATGGRS